MKKSDAAFPALVTGALTLYLAGAFLYCSVQDFTPADQAIARGVGVALGASALIFFCVLMRYLNVLTQEPGTASSRGSDQPPARQSS